MIIYRIIILKEHILSQREKIYHIDIRSATAMAALKVDMHNMLF